MALTEKYVGQLTEALVLARTRAPDLENVCKLNCWGSNIKDVSIVREMPNLEVCSVSVNEIDTLEHFAHCPNLQELYIRKNNVQTLTDINYLKKLPKLRVLWLSENPCASHENYRMTLLRTLPNLQKLDNVVVTEEELAQAAEEGDTIPDLPIPAPRTQPIKSFHTDDEHITSPVTSQGDSVSSESERASSKTSENGDELNQTEQNQSEGEQVEQQQEVKKTPADKKEQAVTLSWEETNSIREQLGLKPLPKVVMMSAKSNPTHHTKTRNANILQSVLLLVKELDRDSLEVVQIAVRSRMESL